MRTGLNLGLLESILALMFFSWVLGAAGTVLSIPIYLPLKEIFREYSAQEHLDGADAGPGQSGRGS